MRTIDFRHASNEQIEEYFKWFVSTISERTDKFILLFNESGGVGILDFSRSSLVNLAQWLKANVAHRNRTDAEVERYQDSAPECLRSTCNNPILTIEWMNHSVSVGTYIGLVFMKEFPVLEWKISQRGKNHANFGRPVLAHPSGAECSVLNIAHSFLAGIYRETDPEKRIMSICDYWENVFKRKTIASCNDPKS